MRIAAANGFVLARTGGFGYFRCAREVAMFMDLVRAARSIRRFDERRPVTRAQLEALVDHARLAPCGANLQRLRYCLVSGPEDCAAVFPHIAWAAALKDWPGPAAGERPTGYIAIVGEGGGDMDCGIAAQTIQLAATGMGLGACMLGSIQRPALMELLGLTPPVTIKLLIAIGVPAETVVLETVAVGGDLAYYRTPDGVHHVPKLRLADVLL
jgi:nitroreductase